MGFSDFFFPLPADPKGRTFFYGGQFLTEELDWDGIAWRWRELTGQLPASANPDFMRFVRMCLRTPVIEPPVLKAIEEFLGLFSELVSTDHAEVRLHERVKKLKREVFDRAWPNSIGSIARPAPKSSCSRPGTTRASSKTGAAKRWAFAGCPPPTWR